MSLCQLRNMHSIALSPRINVELQDTNYIARVQRPLLVRVFLGLHPHSQLVSILLQGSDFVFTDANIYAHADARMGCRDQYVTLYAFSRIYICTATRAETIWVVSVFRLLLAVRNTLPQHMHIYYYREL